VDARSLVHLLRIPVSRSGRISGRPVEIVGGIPQEAWSGLAPTPGGYVFGEAGRTSDVWAFPVGGTGRRLTHSSTWYFGPAVSPDGRTVAYVKQDAWGANVYVAPVAGGAERPVTTDSGIRELLRWFPNGRRLSGIVLRSSGTGGFSHEIDELDSGRRHPLALEAGLVVVGWRPDLTAVAQQLDGRAFAIVDSAGKLRRRFPLNDSLAPLSGLQGSPDGGRVALLVGGGGGRRRVVTEDVASGAVSLAADLGSADSVRVALLRWASDGSLYLARQAGSATPELWRVPARGGVPQRAAVLPDGCDLGSITLSADVRAGACLVADSRPDLWLVERRR
jgi:hypothetical protein